jgi:PAS domain S-box-containing protein
MNPAALLRDAPIKRKLMYIVALSMVVASLFAVTVAVVEQWFIARAELKAGLASHAKLLGANTGAALLFGDQVEAKKTLGALDNIRNIEFAEVRDRFGKPFSSYVREGIVPPGSPHMADGERFSLSPEHIGVDVPIMVEDEQVGSIRVFSNLWPMYETMVWSVASLLVAMLGGVLIAAALIARLHTVITRPIADLVGLMDKVSSEKNYALRADSLGKDELGTLGGEFNDMLSQIQARDCELAQHRAHLEQEVAQRTARLTEAQHIAHLGSWEWDIVNDTLNWSDEIYRIFGLTPQQFEATYESFMRVVHPDDRQLVDDSIRQVLEQGHAYSLDHRILLPDGAVRHVHEQAEVARDEDGRATRMAGTVQDVTEARLAAEQIRKQQELTTQIIETIPMRVFWKDRAFRYLGCNTSFARHAGVNSPAELIGKDDFHLPWEAQAEAYRADDRQVMEMDTQHLSYDEPQTTPAGGHVWLRTSKVPLHNAANEVVGVLGTYEDITERKNMEIALRESEERFRMAFENSAIGMALVGLDGRWLKVNDSLCRIVGYPEQELLDRGFQDITHPDDLQADFDNVTQLLAGKIGHYQMEKRYMHKDGHIVWIRLSASLVRNAQGSPVHFVSQIEDFTEEKQAEEKIRRLNEELEIKVQDRTRQLLETQETLVRKEKLAVLGQVAGSVGHELRNPLGVMSNAVYFLQAVLSDADDSVKEYLGIIKGEIAASERIVSDLLDSVRTKPPHPEIVGVAQLIDQVLGKCAIPPSVSVRLDISATLPLLRVDAMQIHQVFRNLISNGVEAMPEGGTLEIRAVENKPEGEIVVSVHDTGTGIAPDTLPRLFQPLFTTKARGIGLGLVVVKNLTEANGGRVEVASEVGNGTTFTITLPASSVSAEGA